MKQGHNTTLKASWKPAAGSPAKEIDTKMNKEGKTAEVLVESKHAVKKMPVKEAAQMARRSVWKRRG